MPADDSGDDDDDDLMTIGKGLPNLREFHLKGDQSDISTDGIDEMYKYAGELSLLTMESVHNNIEHDDEESMSETFEIISESARHILEIKDNRDIEEVSFLKPSLLILLFLTYLML